MKESAIDIVRKAFEETEPDQAKVAFMVCEKERSMKSGGLGWVYGELHGADNGKINVDVGGQVTAFDNSDEGASKAAEHVTTVLGTGEWLLELTPLGAQIKLRKEPT